MITSYFAPKRRRHDSTTTTSNTCGSSGISSINTASTTEHEGQDKKVLDGRKRLKKSANDDEEQKNNDNINSKAKKTSLSPPISFNNNTNSTVTVTPVTDSSSTGTGSSTRSDCATSATATAFSPQVEELLIHLHDHTTKDEEEEGDPLSWRVALSDHLKSSKFKSLANFVSSERAKAPTIGVGKTGCIYPPSNEVFNALNLLPLHKIKVVIVGQDPYHQYNQGHGLAFSVKRGVKIPPSLRNIYKELLNDKEVPEFNKIPLHGYLGKWSCKEGVLLLNTVLTVRHGEANSHSKKGWEEFTDVIIDTVVKYHKNRGVVFLLWGKPASKKTQSILQKHASSKTKKHVIITTSHPSPLGATKTNEPFLTSKCFSRTNKALIQMGLKPVNWNVD